MSEIGAGSGFENSVSSERYRQKVWIQYGTEKGTEMMQYEKKQCANRKRRSLSRLLLWSWYNLLVPVSEGCYFTNVPWKLQTLLAAKEEYTLFPHERRGEMTPAFSFFMACPSSLNNWSHFLLNVL